MLQRVKQAFSVLRKGHDYAGVSGLWNPFGNQNFDHHSRVIHGWTYIALEAIASEVSRVPLKLKRKSDESEIESHPILDVLERPNPFQPGSELKYFIQVRLDAYGDALLQKDKDRAPKELRPLENTGFQIDFLEEEDMIIYRRTHGSKIDTLTREDVLHLKYPGDTIYKGTGKLQYLSEWLQTVDLSDNYVNQILRKGPFANGMLKTPAQSKPQMDKIKETFEQRYANSKKAGEVMFLPKDTDYIDMNASLDNIQYTEFDRQVRDKILAGFRVPKSIVGVSETGDSQSDQFVAHRNFLKLTIKPKVEYLVNYLNAFFVPLYDSSVFLDFEDPTPENREQKLKERDKAVNRWMTINEIRAEDGMPPVSGGDQLFTPRGMTPVGEVQEDEGNNQQSNSVSATLVDAFEKSLDGEVPETEDERIKREFWESLTEEQAEQRRADIQEEQKFFERNTENEQRIADTVEDIYNTMREIAISEIPSDVGEKAQTKSIEDILEDENLSQELINSITPILVDISREEGKNVMNRLSTNQEFRIDKQLSETIERIADESSKAHITTMSKRLIEDFNEALNEGDTREEMIDRIDDLFINRERAEQFARTTRFQSANQARRASYKQSDVVKTVKWHTAEDELVCKFCRPRNGEVVDVNEKFFDQGDDVWSEQNDERLNVITAGGDPPLHPNCRCMTLADEIEV